MSGVDCMIDSLPNTQNLARSKLKAFADDNIYVTEKLKFVLGWVENIMGKGETSIFSFSQNVFKRLFL